MAQALRCLSKSRVQNQRRTLDWTSATRKRLNKSSNSEFSCSPQQGCINACMHFLVIVDAVCSSVTLACTYSLKRVGFTVFYVGSTVLCSATFLGFGIHAYNRQLQLAP